MKITENKLKQIIKDIIKESLNEDFKGKDYLTILEIKKKVLECYSMSKSIDNQPMMKAFEDLWSAISKTKFGTIDEAMSIHQDGTIFDKYNLPWNEVDTDAEQHHGIWYITVDFFDYTEHLGVAEIDRQFKTLEECLEFAQNYSLEDAYKLCNEEITDEGFSSISLNIMCQEDNGVLREMANTRMYVPKEHSSVDFGELENKGLQDLF